MKPDEAPARPDSLRSVVGVAALCVLALLALAGVKSYRDLDAARGQERRLEVQIRQTGERIERLRGRIERLRGDPVTLERLAREELGLVRPGDVVIVLPADDAAAAPRAEGRRLPLPPLPPPAPAPTNPAPTNPAPTPAAPVPELSPAPPPAAPPSALSSPPPAPSPAAPAPADRH